VLCVCVCVCVGGGEEEAEEDAEEEEEEVWRRAMACIPAVTSGTCCLSVTRANQMLTFSSHARSLLAPLLWALTGSFGSQCCSGGCGKATTDATTTTCIMTTAPTMAPSTVAQAPTARTAQAPTASKAPTPASNDDSYYYYYYDDDVVKTGRHGNEDSSPHWSAVGASVPIAAIILIIAVLAAVGVVVLPKFVRSTRASWEKNSKRSLSPSGPSDDAWVSAGSVTMNQEWMSTLIKHAGPEYDAQCDAVHNDMTRNEYENDYMEVDAIEMSEIVNEDF
jgi:hypothetical protein